MILYIHGFGGNGAGTKASLVRKWGKEEGIPVVAPSLSTYPELALDTLRQICISFVHEKIMLIGSSLGGFYARVLAEEFGLKAVLINPALSPYELLRPYCGILYDYYDNTPWFWTKRQLDSLLNYYPQGFSGNAEYLVLVESGDEIVDYRDAKEKFFSIPFSEVVITEGGSHEYCSFEMERTKIITFYKKRS